MNGPLLAVDSLRSADHGGFVPQLLGAPELPETLIADVAEPAPSRRCLTLLEVGPSQKKVSAGLDLFRQLECLCRHEAVKNLVWVRSGTSSLLHGIEPGATQSILILDRPS